MDGNRLLASDKARKYNRTRENRTSAAPRGKEGAAIQGEVDGVCGSEAEYELDQEQQDGEAADDVPDSI